MIARFTSQWLLVMLEDVSTTKMMYSLSIGMPAIASVGGRRARSLSRRCRSSLSDW